MLGIKCKNCKNLVNDWCDVKADSPDPAIVRDCVGFEPFTNGDRIRSMSDEKLANFLWSFDVDKYSLEDNCGNIGICTIRKLEEWIKQPAEVE